MSTADAPGNGFRAPAVQVADTTRSAGELLGLRRPDFTLEDLDGRVVSEIDAHRFQDAQGRIMNFLDILVAKIFKPLHGRSSLKIIDR